MPLFSSPRTLFAAFLLSSFFSACSGPSHGLILQFAEGIAAQVAFADVLFFKGDAVKCANLNKDNSSSTGPYKDSVLSYNPLKFSTPGAKLLINGLPDATQVTVYVLGVNSKKEAIAQGCKEGLTLKSGQILALELPVSAL